MRGQAIIQSLLEEEIVRLRGRGDRNREIAHALAIDMTAVRRLVRHLVRQKRIAPRRRGRKSSFDLESRRMRILIAMRLRGESLKKIGKRLGISGTWAHQLLGQAKRVAPERFASENRRWHTVEEAAAILHRPYQFLCQVLRTYRIVRKKANRYLLNAKAMARLRVCICKADQETLQRTCRVCRKPFVARKKSEGRYVPLCSMICRKQYQNELRYHPPPPEKQTKMSKRHAALWERLQGHVIPANERWLALYQASTCAGVSVMVIEWLRIRGFVTVQPHPTRRYHGRAMNTFAKSEMRIVRKVYALSSSVAGG